MKNIKEICTKYKHGIPMLIYIPIYLLWFSYLEKTVTKRYTIIHMAADDYIPFCEYFIIPYLLWFVYVAAVVLWTFFKDRNECYKVCIFLGTGMTIFLIISTFFPNGHHLRPMVMPRDNFFTHLVQSLYRVDTATNLWPSIHVYNSLGAHFAIIKSSHLQNHRGIRIASLLLATSIIMSTMLLKQHSVFDVLTAFVLAAIMYAVVYRHDMFATIKAGNSDKKARPQVS